jgi:hypothetical protein
MAAEHPLHSDTDPLLKDFKEKTRLDYFTDRDEAINLFNKIISRNDETVPVLVYHGVGGIGKSTLVEKLRTDLDTLNTQIRDKNTQSDSSEIRVANQTEIMPHAYVDFGDNRVNDVLDVLVRLAVQLTEHYKFKFPRFGTAIKVLKRMGGDPPPDLFEEDTVLEQAIDFGLSFLPNQASAIKNIL